MNPFPSTPMEVSFDMRSKWLGRLPALTGLIFPIFGFAKGGGDDSAPTNASSGQQIAAYVQQHGMPNLNSLVHIELWAFLSVMVFTLVLYSRLRPRGQRRGGAHACLVPVARGGERDPVRPGTAGSNRKAAFRPTECCRRGLKSNVR